MFGKWRLDSEASKLCILESTYNHPHIYASAPAPVPTLYIAKTFDRRVTGCDWGFEAAEDTQSGCKE